MQTCVGKFTCVSQCQSKLAHARAKPCGKHLLFSVDMEGLQSHEALSFNKKSEKTTKVNKERKASNMKSKKCDFHFPDGNSLQC